MHGNISNDGFSKKKQKKEELKLKILIEEKIVEFFGLSAQHYKINYTILVISHL